MMLSIVPGALRATMSLTAACIRKNGARRLTATWASNSSGVVSSRVPRAVSPAALTRQSTRPSSATAAATDRWAWATSATSAWTNRALAPAAWSSAASASPGWRRRPVTATAAPSRAAARATPAPTPWVPPLTRTTLPPSSAIHASWVVAAPAGVQSGLARAAGRRPASTSPTPRAAAAKVAAVARRVRPIRWGVRTTLGWSNRGGWRFGVEDVQADPAQPPRFQGGQGGVQVEQAPSSAVDQDGPGPDAGQDGGVDQVVGGLGQGGVQGQHVAGRGQLAQVRAVDPGRWGADRVVGQHPHAEGGGQLADPAADAPVADDPDGGPVQVADGDAGPLGPAALTDQPGQRPQPLDQVQDVGQDPFGDGPGATVRGDDHGDAAGAGRRQVDPVDPDAGAGQHPQPGGAGQQGGVHDRVGAHDRPLGDGQVLRAGLGHELDAVAEDPGHQGLVDGPEGHHHRPAAAHGSAPGGPGGLKPSPPVDRSRPLLALTTRPGATRCSTPRRSGLAIRSSRQPAARAPMPALSGLTDVSEICRSSARKVSS